MELRRSVTAAFGVALTLNPVGSAVSAETCGLALVLAMDASKSMDSSDFHLAFHGTAAALRTEAVQAAILAQAPPIAISAFEWSGQNHQEIVHDWTMLLSRADIENVARSLESHTRGGIGQKTGTGSALEFSFALLESGPLCNRKVVDVVSDGYNSDGITPGEFYAGHRAKEVTVNALVIGGEARPLLRNYFEVEVVRGPGAFSLSTIDFSDYPRAMEEKLLREIASPRLSGAFEPPFPVQ